jgi:type IV pilus assembly protein PilE
MQTAEYWLQQRLQHLQRLRASGFSLLELMLVLLLVTVLLAMAVPSYQQYRLRVNRATAIETLLAVAQCQQGIYAQDFHFDTRRCLPELPEGHYHYRMDPADTASTTVFTVIAIPQAAQQLDSCQELRLDQSGWRSISGPQELQRKCWEGR